MSSDFSCSSSSSSSASAPIPALVGSTTTNPGGNQGEVTSQSNFSKQIYSLILDSLRSLKSWIYFSEKEIKVLAFPSDNYTNRTYLYIDRVRRENIGINTSISSSSSSSSSDETILESLKDLHAATDRYSFYNLVMLCRNPEYILTDYSALVCVQVLQGLKLMDSQNRIPNNVKGIVLRHVLGTGEDMMIV